MDRPAACNPQTVLIFFFQQRIMTCGDAPATSRLIVSYECHEMNTKLKRTRHLTGFVCDSEVMLSVADADELPCQYGDGIISSVRFAFRGNARFYKGPLLK